MANQAHTAQLVFFCDPALFTSFTLRPGMSLSSSVRSGLSCFW